MSNHPAFTSARVEAAALVNQRMAAANLASWYHPAGPCLGGVVMFVRVPGTIVPSVNYQSVKAAVNLPGFAFDPKVGVVWWSC